MRISLFNLSIRCNLQHYEADISELELYFVILNNEYGEQTEEELLPGGKNIRVTNENVITFIHLVSNHRLNFQVVHHHLSSFASFNLNLRPPFLFNNPDMMRLLLSDTSTKFSFPERLSAAYTERLDRYV